jgi:hypothetical protein
MAIKTTMVAMAALAVAVTTPALARNAQYRAQASFNSGAPFGAYAQGAPLGAYAQAYGAYGSTWSGCERAHSPNPAWDVCEPGKAAQSGSSYVGSDPDGRVRAQMQWDPRQGD